MFLTRLTRQLARNTTLPIPSISMSFSFNSNTISIQRRNVTVHSSTAEVKKKKKPKPSILTPEEMELEQLATQGDVESQHRFGMLMLAKAKGDERKHPELEQQNNKDQQPVEDEQVVAKRAKEKASVVISEIRAQQRANNKIRRTVVKTAKNNNEPYHQPNTMSALINASDIKANGLRMKGVEWLLKAHHTGYVPSTVALANVMYSNVLETKETGAKGLASIDKVIHLWSSVAPHPDACFNLGKLYYDGCEAIPEFVPNRIESIQWFEEAAKEGDTASQFWLGYVYHYGDALANILPDGNQTLAHLTQASQGGHSDASMYLYTLHLNGDESINIETNPSQAMKYLNIAAYEQDSDEAYNVLAELYFHGYGKDEDGYENVPDEDSNDGTVGTIQVKQDVQKALNYYLKAGDLGNSNALCSAAAMYYHGLGADKNLLKSYQLYQLAVDADSDNKEAWRNLASCYYHGHGTKQDIELAKTILKTVLKDEKEE